MNKSMEELEAQLKQALHDRQVVEMALEKVAEDFAAFKHYLWKLLIESEGES